MKYWNKITYPFRPYFSKNILVIGTASEGKTTLVQDIGKYFNIPYSYEWAKDYMLEHCLNDNELTVTDFLAFLQGQFDLNKKVAASGKITIADTDSLITAMYSKYYSEDSDFVLPPADYEIIKKVAIEYTKASRWDKIFFILPHDNFVDDNVRYNKHGSMECRQELKNILEDLIDECGLTFKVEYLNGSYLENYETVKKYIESI